MTYFYFWKGREGEGLQDLIQTKGSCVLDFCFAYPLVDQCNSTSKGQENSSKGETYN